MVVSEPLQACEWRAELMLRFAHRGAETVLASRRHSGPLAFQKALYPEGRQVCHGIVLHPPGGIAGGDHIVIAADAQPGAQALLTTPGAGKWYRCEAAPASQHLRFTVGAGATLEWLPRETIVFDGARAHMQTEVSLADDACFIGWEMLCLGRSAAGERFHRGWLRLATRITLGGRPHWIERGSIDGGSPLLDSPVGFAGHAVSGTLLAAGRDIPPALLAQARDGAAASAATAGCAGITALPRLLVARYLGDSVEHGYAFFLQLWRLLRPVLLGREACPPRIWST
jgi:urease accessory protein